MQRSVPIGILTNPTVFMASVYEELGDIEQAQSCGQMERCVAIVCKVGVLDVLRVVFDDALEEGEVFEVDGTSDAGGDIDPGSR